MIKEQDILRILAEGVVPAERAKSQGYRQPSRFLENITDTTQRVTERNTGNTFYRLGNEFHSEESLALVSERHPLADVRDKALQILGSIKSEELLESIAS